MTPAPREVSPVTFAIDASADQETAQALTHFNDSLIRLHGRRVTEISISGPLRESKLAWKLATYQQAALYRFVMLASGCALNWNARNPLCAYLAARALIETAAIFLTLVPALDDLMTKEDLRAIDSLLMNRTFSTRDEQLVQSHPNLKAVSILTIIDKLEKHGLKGVRQHYDFLSERCHPNAIGQSQFFGVRDPATNTTHYSDWRDAPMHMDYILGGASLLPLTERGMEKMDAAILRLSEIQHRIKPVA